VARPHSSEGRPYFHHRWWFRNRRCGRQTINASGQGVPREAIGGLLQCFAQDECGFDDLRAAASGKTYQSPSGLALNATFINFLRRVLPASAVRFRMTDGLQPIVVLADGRAVAVLMPVKP
jgi:hypothetical protein